MRKSLKQTHSHHAQPVGPHRLVDETMLKNALKNRSGIEALTSKHGGDTLTLLETLMSGKEGRALVAQALQTPEFISRLIVGTGIGLTMEEREAIKKHDAQQAEAKHAYEQQFKTRTSSKLPFVAAKHPREIRLNAVRLFDIIKQFPLPIQEAAINAQYAAYSLKYNGSAEAELRELVETFSDTARDYFYSDKCIGPYMKRLRNSHQLHPHEPRR